jgi:hypothetical protein
VGLLAQLVGLLAQLVGLLAQPVGLLPQLSAQRAQPLVFAQQISEPVVFHPLVRHLMAQCYLRVQN